MSDLIAGDFNYASVDEETATKLEYFAKSGKALIKKSQVEFIAKFGELLSDARKMLASHNKTEGTFVKWSTAEFDLSSKTVYNYVNSWDRILCNGYTTYLNWSATALYLASADDFPKPVQKKLEKIPATDLVRTSDVKRLVAEAKPKPKPALKPEPEAEEPDDSEAEIESPSDSQTDVLDDEGEPDDEQVDDDPAQAPSNGAESVSAAKLVDALFKQHVGYIARGLTAIAKANRGEGKQFKKADDALNEMIYALQAMREGEQ